MAESCAPLPVAGYENEFVDSIPDTLSCPVCLLPFRDPHLVSCCGAKFCEQCIGRVKASGQPCPLCKQEFVSLLDRGDQRKVLNFKVRCSRHKDGCQWVGELRHVVPHEREECEWAVVECSYQCGAHLPRRLMAEHEQDLCPQRPMEVKLDREMRKMETKLTAMETILVTEREQHKREMSKMEKDHRRDMAAMKIEINKQHERELAEHKEEMESKMAEQKKEVAELKNEYTSKLAETLERVRKIEEEVIPQMRGITAQHVPIEFIMTQYSTHKKNDDDWYSPPFYTGPGGYKMCISVDANGWSDGAGTHVSVFVYLMRGEYDSRLVWPFRGDITIQLVNHSNDDDHREKTVPFSDAAVAYGSANRVTTGERATKGRGIPQFISHTEVESSTETRRYIDNNCLTFRVTNIVVHSV